MQIVSQGIDIVVVARIERIWQDHGNSFLKRIYTLGERDYCLNCKTPGVRLSGRFAAKEAVLKALGTGWIGGIAWTDIETLPDELGKPHVTLSNRTAELATKAGIDEMLMSISHAGEYAVASAIGVATGEKSRES